MNGSRRLNILKLLGLLILLSSLLIWCSHEIEPINSSGFEITQHSDDVKFQEAFDLFPESGGILNLENAHFIFTKPVTRSFDNITIIGRDHFEGSPEVYISNDNSTPLFVVGGKGWTFIDLYLDLGGIDYNGFEDSTVLIRVSLEDNSNFPEHSGQPYIE